jgi:hypothetical protein
MEFSRSKTTATLLALFLVLTITATLVALPNANAHTPPINIPTFAYLNAFPDPIGVSQTISLFGWLDLYPPTANGAYGDRWEKLNITVTDPDGNIETLGPFTSDPVGTIFTTYTPDTPGTYTFQFNFPGQVLAGNNPPPGGGGMFSAGAVVYIGDYYQPSSSAKVSVTVQQEPIAGAPNYPLPSEYWTNPISQSGHQGWAHITGDWLATGGNINDYTQPPLTAHIAWTKPINFGGVGGQPLAIDSGGDNYYSYLSYEGMFNPPIIMNGHLYYNIANPPEYGFVDVDLRTGQQVWYQNGTGPQQLGFGFLKQNYPQLSYGQELDYESPNQHGLIPYLWSTYTATNGSSVWAMYDPFTGNWICSLWNVPAGGGFFGASNMITDSIGSLVSYSASTDFKTMSVWNSTAVLQNTYPSNNAFLASNGYWMWRPPLGANIDASVGTTIYNITGSLPAGATSVTFGAFGPANALGLSLLGMDTEDQIAIYGNATATLGESAYPTNNAYALVGINIHPGQIGQVKWSQVYSMPAGNLTLNSGFMGSGVFTLFQKETCLWMGFSATTGQQLWTTTKAEVSNHMYGVSGGIYKGVLYSGDSIGEGGTIYAYNATTGALLWNVTSPSMGFTGYWPNIPMGISTFASGVIFWYGSEHSPGPTLEPGFKIGAMNATNGLQIWNITFWSAGGGFAAGIAVADGYAVALNAYDNQIYAFGKGPTATTAETPLAAITMGQSLVIQGTVTDISAGTQQSAIAARFPNGVAAVSDNSQTAWMEYVYMQNPRPSNALGVPVSITVIDPNNNVYDLGSATSDSSGHYSFTVTPSMTPVPGTYTVIAAFGGSNSYWPSYAESTFVVDPAPTASPPIEFPQPIDNTLTIVAMGIVLLIAIAIVGILLLRKK